MSKKFDFEKQRKAINAFKVKAFKHEPIIDRKSIVNDLKVIDELRGSKSELVIAIPDKKGRLIELFKSGKNYFIKIARTNQICAVNNLKDAEILTAQAIVNSHALFVPTISEPKENEKPIPTVFKFADSVIKSKVKKTA